MVGRYYTSSTECGEIVLGRLDIPYHMLIYNYCNEEGRSIAKKSLFRF
jgi:hypothetical protein